MVTEVLGCGKFYVQPAGDQKIASIQQQLAFLNLQEAPLLGAFNPKKGDTVLCHFLADNSWYRAMVSSLFNYCNSEKTLPFHGMWSLKRG